MIKAPGFWWREPGVAAALLAPFAAIYGKIAARRLQQPGERVGVPVICVGNPTVGGAGKTPTALTIARLLLAAGERPVFLSRGYGGRLAGPVMVEPDHSAIQVGDEPLLLARVAPTIVAHNRVAGARLARERDASVIVMDDGFQNPSLAKDFSLLVIDSRGAGNGCVFPAGPLRAPLAPQLGRASAILLSGEPAASIPRSAAPVLHGTLEPDAATIGSLAGRKVLAFAGIGDSEKFFATLAAAGIDAPVRRGFPDHHRYTAAEAAALVAAADRDGLQLLTTEKDLVRLRQDTSVAPLAERALALPVTMKIEEPEAFRRLVLAAVKPA